MRPATYTLKPNPTTLRLEEAVTTTLLTLNDTTHALCENDEGDVLCPKCGHDDVAMWADDGEADAADWWKCETFSGGCGADGAVVSAATPTRTQNGLPVAP